MSTSGVSAGGSGEGSVFGAVAREPGVGIAGRSTSSSAERGGDAVAFAGRDGAGMSPAASVGATGVATGTTANGATSPRIDVPTTTSAAISIAAESAIMRPRHARACLSSATGAALMQGVDPGLIEFSPAQRFGCVVRGCIRVRISSCLVRKTHQCLVPALA